MWIKFLIFIIATAGIIYVSRTALRKAGSHGFYRFFAWEAILVLLLLNLEHWFEKPFSLSQIISWVCLIISLYLVLHSLQLLRMRGRPNHKREESALLGSEKTTALVTVGAYKYIRHPLYSSLLFLAWGVFFKLPSWIGGGLVLIATIFLTTTARVEEVENKLYFGVQYEHYMKRTKMFIPYIF